MFRGRVYGLENIPESGAFIAAANHVSFLDPPFISAIMKRSDMYYFARKTLMVSGVMGFIIKRINTIPINRETGSDVAAIKRAISLVKNGHGVVIFPEGARSSDGKIQEAKPGIGLIACKTSVPVIPIRLFGTYEILNRTKKWPNFSTKPIVVVGSPIHASDYDPGLNYENKYHYTSNVIMNRIRSLQKPELQASK
jgi:1-acyl-sn-glycerol-3-phosphate acyltransferase